MMDDKYTKLIKTLPEDSQELWFEYNLEVNRILLENANLQGRVDKLQQENKKQKEIIDKTRNILILILNVIDLDDIRTILEDKEV